MRLHVVERSAVTITPNTCVVVPHFQDKEIVRSPLLNQETFTHLGQLREQRRISGRDSEAFFLPAPNAPYAGVLVVGLGKADKFTPEILRRAGGRAAAIFSSHRIDRAVLDAEPHDNLPVAAFVDGLVLGEYDYAAYKRKPEEARVLLDELIVVAPSGPSLETLRLACGHSLHVCENTNWARDLANLPPNDLTPPALGGHAVDMARDVGAEYTVLDVDDMRKLGMNAILAVARGSSKAPKLIVLRHKGEGAKETLALVGKGITFDSGGISLKPGLNMHEMKYDMCGAAAVLGAFKTIAEAKTHVDLLCVVPTAENKTGDDAARPGDIVRAYNGKTIEIHNTDAEGRLILADALSYTAAQYKPAAMVDAATLTGAALVALGHVAAPVMGTDEVLLEQLRRAADATGERVWPLPMWDDFSRMMEGTHADLCNIGPPMQAGTITAGCFLKEFVGDVPWAHLDIAGTAWGVDNVPYWSKKHATGWGVRLLTEWVLGRSGLPR
ncbi:MAG: leucyl aminopeptidase [Candidatus Hydrogenedentales bacterium]